MYSYFRKRKYGNGKAWLLNCLGYLFKFISFPIVSVTCDYVWVCCALEQRPYLIMAAHYITPTAAKCWLSQNQTKSHSTYPCVFVCLLLCALPPAWPLEIIIVLQSFHIQTESVAAAPVGLPLGVFWGALRSLMQTSTQQKFVRDLEKLPQSCAGKYVKQKLELRLMNLVRWLQTSISWE